jgi:hypothetical protein
MKNYTYVKNGKQFRVTVVSGPDNVSRYHYDLEWADFNRAYCGTCGACETRHCACYHLKQVSGQSRFGLLPKKNGGPG